MSRAAGAVPLGRILAGTGWVLASVLGAGLGAWLGLLHAGIVEAGVFRAEGRNSIATATSTSRVLAGHGRTVSCIILPISMNVKE